MDHSFGTWIKRRRRALDLTQQELAGRVGCSPSLIFKIEADARRPSRQIAELLAKHLEIPAGQRELFLKVARQDKAVDALDSVQAPAASRTVSVSGPDLPRPLTPLVGREHEVGAIIRQLEDPACRLLTLTGPGGVGKTRLALEVAHRLTGTLTHGAYFVPLVGTSASEFIVPAIADVLGFIFSGAMELKTQLFNHLREKHILLVLDNLEHLLDGIELLDELLERTPTVTLLATSREQLNLRAEWVFEVQGLPVPANDELKDPDSSSAAALFIQRARQVNAGFSPAAEDRTAVTRICRLVEGLPLGLELAATWVRMMSVSEIADEIDRSMDFLTTTARDVPQRHRSIRAVFDHSWNLLPVEERTVLMRLSVFHGGFTREAAEQVAGATLPVLSALVDKSLIRRSGMSRYDLHELLRQYAAMHLQEKDAEQNLTHRNHSAYYLRLVQASESALRSSLQKDVLSELRPEIDNFRAAWDHAVDTVEVDLLRQATGAIYYFYELHQYFQEAETLYRRGAEMLRTRLEESGPSHDPAQRAKLEAALGDILTHQAFFLQRMGRNREALELHQASIDLLEPLNETYPLAFAYTLFGPCAGLPEIPRRQSFT